MERPDYSGPELCALEAHEVVGLLHRGEVSPTELLDASLARIADIEPQVNATVTLCGVRAQAKLHELADHTLLAGLPIGVNDLLAVGGVRTTFGTKGLADNIPSHSDPLVTLMERNGAQVVGKTNISEFGVGANTVNAIFGATRNAWNLSRNAGCASGGAAVSLATGEVWLSHGSDYGGSLRISAAYSGVVGLRPSSGRAGGGGPLSAWNSEGVQGPMARSVTDCALFLDAMCGFDPSSPISIAKPETPFIRAAGSPLAHPRIAYSPDMGGCGRVTPEVAQLLSNSLAKFSRGGVTIEGVSLQTQHLCATFRTLRALGFLAQYSLMPDRVRLQLEPEILRVVDEGQSLSVDMIANAEINRSVLFNHVYTILQDFDVIATPVVGLPSVPLEGASSTRISDLPYTDNIGLLEFSFLASVISLPALSLPVGFMPDGTPMGLQLIGPNRGEAKLISVARQLELILDLPRNPIDPVIP